MIQSREPWQVRVRALLLTLATLGVLAGCVQAVRRGAARSSEVGTLGFAELLVAACAGLVVLAVAWLCVLVLVATVPLLRHPTIRRTPSRTPGRVATLVAAACGLGLAITPATAQESRTDVGRTVSTVSVLHGLPLPSRPVADDRSRRHVVRPGDSLWSIAAAELGPSATPAEVDTRWRHIHAANVAAIGRDPDLIHPGTVVSFPSTPSRKGPS